MAETPPDPGPPAAAAPDDAVAPGDTEPALQHGERGLPVVRLRPPGLGFSVEGWSVAGIETWLRIPEWSLSIDVGRVATPSVASRHLALSHGHLDHAGGVASWLGLRRMFGMPVSQVYAPTALVHELRTVLAAWERIQGIDFQVELHPAEPGDRFELGSNRVLEALPADHLVPALGWAVLERRSHLLPALRGLDGRAIAARKAAGETVHEHHEVALLAVSGDTMATTARTCAPLRNARMVLHEITLLSEAHPPSLAHAGGHTHLFDVAGSGIAEGCEVFVPYHISQRYDSAQARRLLTAALGAQFGARLMPLLP